MNPKYYDQYNKKLWVVSPTHMMTEIYDKLFYHYKGTYENYGGDRNSTVEQENVDLVMKDKVDKENHQFIIKLK